MGEELNGRMCEVLIFRRIMCELCGVRPTGKMLKVFLCACWSVSSEAKRKVVSQPTRPCAIKSLQSHPPEKKSRENALIEKTKKERNKLLRCLFLSFLSTMNTCLEAMRMTVCNHGPSPP